jgi:hypothetical protein
MTEEVARMRFALLALAAIFSAVIAIPRAVHPKQANDSSDSTPKIELKLIPEKTTIRAGETLKLRVELCNVGTNDVIIAQNVDAMFGNSRLEFFLEHGSVRERGPGMVADGIPEADPDFEKTFVTNWLTLNRGHFYGTYVEIDPISFPTLRKPGRYKIGAHYESRGISSTPLPNGGYLKQEDVDKLPLTAFEGTVDSNVVRIQVVPKSR